MSSRRGQMHHTSGRTHGYGHGNRPNGHGMHPDLPQTSTATSDGRSRKALLSFLLNDEDEGVLNKTAGNVHEGPSDLACPMSAPVLSLRDSSWRRNGQESTQTGIHGPAPSSDASTLTSVIGVSSSNLRLSRNGQNSLSTRITSQDHSKQVTSSSSSIRGITDDINNQGKTENGSTNDKRGVRKKRQRKFVCEKCSFGFYTNSDLQKHISSVHLQLRPYDCSMCDKKFGERSNATKHFKSVHERQRNAACDKCNKVFAFRDGLVRHVRLVHENVRNFHCQYPDCGQSFKQSAHLKKHEQVHMKARFGNIGAGTGAETAGGVRGGVGSGITTSNGSGVHHVRGGAVGSASASATSTRRPGTSAAASASAVRSSMPDGIHRIN